MTGSDEGGRRRRTPPPKYLLSFGRNERCMEGHITDGETEREKER